MTSYEEMADRILEKYNARLEQRKKRRAVIFRTAVGCSGLCAAAVIGLSVWNNDHFKKDLEKGADSNIITETGQPAAKDVTAAVSGGESFTYQTTAAVSVDVTEASQAPTVTSLTVSSPSIKETSASVSGKEQTINTTLPAVLKTTNAPAVTAPAATTNVTAATSENGGTPVSTTIPNSNIRPLNEDERSIIMKKVSLFLAGVMASSGISIPSADAVNGQKDDISAKLAYEFLMDDEPDSHDENVDLDFNNFSIDDYIGSGKNARYKAFEKFVDNGSMDLDINADGSLDEYDYLVFRMFGHKRYYDGDPSDLRVSSADEDDYKYNPYGYYYDLLDYMYNYDFKLFDEWRDRLVDLIPEADLDRAYNAVRKLSFYDDNISYFDNPKSTYGYATDDCLNVFLPAYFATHIKLDPKYFDDEYFEELVPGSSPWRPGSILEGYAKLMGVTSDKLLEMKEFDWDIFINEFPDYYIDVKEGRRPIPDVNMDGIVEFDDTELLRYYRWYICVGENTVKIDEETAKKIEYISANCDFNGNGVAGDMYDEYFVAAYWVLENPDPVWNDSGSAEENDKLIAETFNAGSFEDHIYKSLSDRDIDRSGDADGDNIMKMTDAVLVMQSISNGDKYQLTSKGKFNADLYNTGDGITPMDALELQNKLLKK